MSNLMSGWHTIPKWRRLAYAVLLPVALVALVVLFVI